MVIIEPTVYCRKFDVILTKKDLKEIDKKNARKKAFWIVKRENGACIFLKGNKCSLKGKAPLLCRMFPLFFKVEKKERLMIWFLPLKRRVSSKKLEEKKRIVFEFLKEASRRELKAYFNFLKFLSLKEIEEETLPKEVLKVVKRKM